MASVATKVCKSCGVDVSAAKRIRNPDGTYFCAACWGIQTAGVSAEIKGLDLLPPDLDLSLKGLDLAPKGLDILPSGLDFPTDETTEESTADEIFYPCRVCEGLYTAREVYAEADGETVCKSCWRGPSGETAGPASASPPRLDLAPAPAPMPRKHPKDELFCERCGGVFLAKKLTLSPDGAVLCSRCIKIVAAAKKEAARKARHQAQAFGTTPPRQQGTTSARGLAISAGLSVLAIAWMIFRLAPSEWFTAQKPAHHPARPAITPPADHRAQ